MRRSDWQSRLAQHLQRASLRSFEWGVQDCALFACDGLLAMTDVDPAEDFRGEYHDMVGAYRALQRFAGGGLLETAEKICARHKWPVITLGFVGRGDVVLFKQDGQDTLGLVDMTGRKVVAAGEKGLTYYPLTVVERAWKVE